MVGRPHDGRATARRETLAGGERRGVAHEQNRYRLPKAVTAVHACSPTAAHRMAATAATRPRRSRNED